MEDEMVKPSLQESDIASELRHAVVVLGMHRSGTSALAGVLARLGCDLPEAVMPPNEFNPKGFYESLKLYNLNDAILASGGSSWDDWQSFNPNWLASPQAAAFLERGTAALVEEYQASPLFVLKDPRLCRLLPVWQELFQRNEIQPVYVLPHRSPVEVARSLQTREGWPVTAGLLLWLRHVLEAEAGSRGAKRCFVSYDQLLANWEAVVAKITDTTGLAFPRSVAASTAEVEAFLTASLRHSTETLEDLAQTPLVEKWVGRVYEILERWSVDGEDRSDFAVLDRVRSEFDAMSHIFGPQAQGLRMRALDAEQAQQSAEQAQHQAQVQATTSQESLKAQEEAAQQQVSDLQADLAQSHQDLAEAQKNSRMLRLQLERDFREDLKRLLASHRRQADAQARAQQDQIQQLKQELDQAQAGLRHHEEGLTQLRHERDQGAVERERLNEAVAALRASTSWKITAPLRVLVRAVRRGA
ncbi:sulfotransferase family protein [Epibacterium ulvae]|uniref:sulfotransferase family protein n=1 Tax=Epibacterium ulvae TaxID=1156985 RepID=UPI0024903F9E|nr:sulfotransferase family protein [Epibacterium ulvae]